MKLHSMKNNVYKKDDKIFKYFNSEESFYRELTIAKQLKKAGVTVPEVLDASNNTIVYEFIEGTSYHALTDCFKLQHADALANWLQTFYNVTGKIKGDVNLRNFIYDDRLNICYGIDFEDVCEGIVETDFGEIIAFAATYDPPFTSGKKHCASLLLKEFINTGADLEKIKQAYISEIHSIINRRKNRDYDINEAVSFWEGIL